MAGIERLLTGVRGVLTGEETDEVQYLGLISDRLPVRPELTVVVGPPQSNLARYFTRLKQQLDLLDADGLVYPRRRYSALLHPEDYTIEFTERLVRRDLETRSFPPLPTLYIGEPENGCYPSEIKRVMADIKRVSQYFRTVVHTQSPLVLNEVRPDQALLVTWERQRRKYRWFHELPGAEERLKVYKLGEWWLSYLTGGPTEPFLTTTRKPR